MNKSEVDALAEKFGGRFKLTVLIQKRVKELVKGAARLVETDQKNLVTSRSRRSGREVAFEGLEIDESEGGRNRRRTKSRTTGPRSCHVHEEVVCPRGRSSSA